MEDWSAEQAAQWAVGTLELPPDGAIAAQLHKEFEEEELDGRELLHKMRGTGKKLHKVLKGVLVLEPASAAATQRLLRASAGLREQAERALASPVSEARTPFSVRWGAILATDGRSDLTAFMRCKLQQTGGKQDDGCCRSGCLDKGAEAPCSRARTSTTHPHEWPSSSSTPTTAAARRLPARLR
jgi:hypothetical protein